MLSKENRLKNKKDFDKIFKKGKGFKQDFLFIKIFKNDLDASRFGFIVSKKISKKAVARNKIKRKMRESVRLKIEKISPGYDLVFLPDINIKEKKFKEIDQIINKILIKAKILK